MAEQPELPIEAGGDKPSRLGHASVAYRDARSILTPATGFMADYDYTLNPYSGCGFGCSYCYAAFFSRDADKQANWGKWIEVKANAVGLLRRMRTPLQGKLIYMSSVTDPYQPVEHKLGLVREMLSELVRHQPRLVIQTRSHLVTRDVDLLRQFEEVQVNVTITTDSDEVRKAFEPYCPGTSKRVEAVAELASSGIRSAVTMTPLLPVENPRAFAESLAATGADHFVVQPFHAERGRFVAGTRDGALELVDRLGWTESAYRDTVEILREVLPDLAEGREGFAPP